MPCLVAERTGVAERQEFSETHYSQVTIPHSLFTSHFSTVPLAHECHYLNDNDSTELIIRCESIGRMLQSMMDKASLFCKPS
jgi:hypothetical protein